MNKALKNTSLILIALIMFIGVFAPVEVEAASISKAKASVYVGDTVTLKLTGTTLKKTWSSSNKKVATVTKKGVVKGKSAGTATITVKYGKNSKKCKVTVKKAPALNVKTATINVNKTKKLVVQRPIGAVKWTTSNKNVATVSAKGIVTGKKAGSAKITAKVNGRTLTCKVTIKNANATANTLKFTTSDGGDFITGISAANVKFALDNASTAVKVQVINAADEVIQTKTFASCKKNTEYTYTWNGKGTNGEYVGAGSYYVRVTAGTTKSISPYMQVLTENPFAAGTGSVNNPYQVNSVAHLEKLTNYPARNFVQTANIDGGYKTIAAQFSSSCPFTGTYDGKNYTISNLMFNGTETTALFRTSSGTISNVNMKNIYATCTKFDPYAVAALVGENSGTVKNCTLSDATISGETCNDCGGLVGINKNAVIGCKVSNITVNGSQYSNWTPGEGGVVGDNRGSVIDCSADSVSVTGWKAGGIVGDNTSSGQCINCVTTGNTVINAAHYRGAIVGWNEGAIVNCTTTTAYPIYGYPN